MENDLFQAITLFCEDVRPEVAGGESLIGVFSDNIFVPVFPIALPKIAIYTRITFNVNFKPEEIEIFIDANGKEDQIGLIDINLIAKGIIDAKAVDSPISTIVARAIAAPFSIEKRGRILTYLTTSGKKLITGTLNVEEQP